MSNIKDNLLSVLELKKLRRGKKLSKDDYHRISVDIFSESLDFDFSEVIGRGKYSTVLRVWNESATRGFAMRVVLTEDIGPEEREWRRLRHRNLLNLLDTEDFPVFELTWFLSPVVELTLEDALVGKVFQNEPDAFELASSWIKEITSALGYLHEEELCFLNLKTSNVMICNDRSIKLFGFHRLDRMDCITTG